VLAACALVLGSCATVVEKTAVNWHNTELGLCEDYPEESRSISAAAKDLAAAHAAGARVLRIAFGWDAMEPERGKYDWSFWDDFVRLATEEYQVRLIPYVCYTPKWAATDQGENYWRSPPRDPGDFARFVDALVHRYKNRIHSWELWNEPDNQAYWLGTTAQFAALVRAGSAAVRSADPQATVVLGGIAGEVDFLAKLLRDEKIGPAVDVVNVHNYFETWHPNAIEHLPAYLESAAGLVRDTGGKQALWMAEAGYSSVGDRAETSSVYRVHYRGEHTDQAQAAALVRMVVTALATERLSLFAWYRINDLGGGQEVIGDDNNRHLGVRDVHGVPKPALAAFGYIGKLFAQPFVVLLPSIGVEDARGHPEIRAFRLKDGRGVVVAWMAMPNEPANRAPELDDRSALVRIKLPDVHRGQWRVHDATGRSVPSSPFAAGDGELRLRLHGGDIRIAEIGP
jgi:hypothetical protein